MNKIILPIIACVFLTSCLSGCQESDSNGGDGPWSWELGAGEWVEITFTQDILFCVGSDRPEVVFASVKDICGDLWVFQEQDGETVSWYNKRPINELEHILPNVPCAVNAELSCVLVIEC